MRLLVIISIEKTKKVTDGRTDHGTNLLIEVDEDAYGKIEDVSMYLLTYTSGF